MLYFWLFQSFAHILCNGYDAQIKPWDVIRTLKVNILKTENNSGIINLSFDGLTHNTSGNLARCSYFFLAYLGFGKITSHLE